uniref:Uncharacterized protein n=1 Tax=Fagus sylvatica TaxID=28930 RepID=A0A2N9HG42_FAGSY
MQPTDQIEEVEPPHSLTSPPHYDLSGWQPTEIEEVEPPHSLTWQPTQIEEVEPPPSLISPPHTLTHSLTSRSKRTGPGIMDRVIAHFSSGEGRHKKKYQPTIEEKKMLKKISARNRPTDQMEEVEPPHSLTSPPHYGLTGWQPTEIEEVEPPHSLIWQPTQIKEVEPPLSLTSPSHTLSHSLTSSARRTGPGIMDRVITLFSSGGSRHKKKYQPTTDEKNMPKEICARNRTEEVEPPHSLTSPLHYGLPGWQPTEIEEVEPTHSLTWQPTQIEDG